MYKLIGTAHLRAFRVIWMLEELGLGYEHIADNPQSEGILALNPAGKIPILIVEGTPISDSTAILTYLADHHAALTHDAGSIARARQDSLTQFLLDEFDAALWVAVQTGCLLPEVMPQGGVRTSLRWEFEQSQKALMTRVGEGPFVMGDVMTVPDLILTDCLIWALRAKFPIIDHRLSAYLDRMRARPAYMAAYTASRAR